MKSRWRTRAKAPIAPTDQLRVRADRNVYVRTVEKGSRLSVAIGTRKLELTGPAMHFAQRALAAGKFEASDGLAWGEGEAKLDWSDVEKTLTRFVNEGLLERVAK